MKFSFTGVIYRPEAEVREGTSVVLLAGVEEGVYAVDFGRKTVEFMERSNFEVAKRFFSKYIRAKNLYETPEFTQRDLRMNRKFPGVKSYQCGSITVFDSKITKRNKKLVMEYIDMTRGEIPEHDHGEEQCIEVYLSTTAPYRGEFCDIGESHKPFCNKTLAVKMYL